MPFIVSRREGMSMPFIVSWREGMSMPFIVSWREGMSMPFIVSWREGMSMPFIVSWREGMSMPFIVSWREGMSMPFIVSWREGMSMPFIVSWREGMSIPDRSFPGRLRFIVQLYHNVLVQPLYCRKISPDGRFFDTEELVVRVLRGFIEDSAIPPVKVEKEPPDSDYRYKLRDGTHRFYCSVAAGFSHVPAIEVKPSLLFHEPSCQHGPETR